MRRVVIEPRPGGFVVYQSEIVEIGQRRRASLLDALRGTKSRGAGRREGADYCAGACGKPGFVAARHRRRALGLPNSRSRQSRLGDRCAHDKIDIPAVAPRANQPIAPLEDSGAGAVTARQRSPRFTEAVRKTKRPAIPRRRRAARLRCVAGDCRSSSARRSSAAVLPTRRDAPHPVWGTADALRQRRDWDLPCCNPTEITTAASPSSTFRR